MPSTCRDDEGRFPILVLKIKVTASSNKLFCDGRMAVLGSEVQRSGPTCSLLVVDEGLRACRRQQRRNSPCIIESPLPAAWKSCIIPFRARGQVTKDSS